MIKEIVIGLCDDDENIHRIIEKMVKDYEVSVEISTRLVHFMSAEEFLAFKGKLDMVLLDIDMPGMDGIEAGHQARRNNLPCRIVMLTGKTERFKEAFPVGAVAFVTKLVEETELFAAIEEVERRMIGEDVENVSDGGKWHCVRQKDILYVMADGSQTRVFLENTSFRSENSLDWWEQELDERMFFRTHRSFVVNLGKIQSMEGTHPIMITGEKISVAKRRRTVFERAYMEYDIRYR